MLTEGQVEVIHAASLEVLWRTGVTVSHKKAEALLGEHGCKVDPSNDRVRFPSTLVEECIAACPGRFQLKARESKNDWDLGDPEATYLIPSQGLNMLDLETWRPRRPTRKEFYDLVTIMDALPTVDGSTNFPWYGFDKVPEAMALLESNAAKIRNTTKPQVEGSVLDNYRWNIEMAQATNQDLINLTNPGAPLTLSDETVEKILYFSNVDMPFFITSGPVGGATGPATIAGLLVQNNAEFLSGAILAQLNRPGTRIICNNMAMLQDMRTGAPGFAQAGNSCSTPRSIRSGVGSGSRLGVSQRARWRERRLSTFRQAMRRPWALPSAPWQGRACSSSMEGSRSRRRSIRSRSSETMMSRGWWDAI